MKQLALAVPCAQSTMHDMLNSAEAKGSNLVPRIHEIFGWPPPPEPGAPPEPSPPLPSPDALELAAMYDNLTDDARESLRSQAALLLQKFRKSAG